MLSSFTAPYSFQAHSGRNYFRFGWTKSGSVLVTSFGVRVVAAGQQVEFVEGLANYAQNRVSWRPYEAAGAGSSAGSADSHSNSSPSSLLEVRLDQYQSVDANSGEHTPVNTCPKLFVVDALTGRFGRVLNTDELVDEAVALAVAAAGQDKSPQQKEELRRLLLQQRDVMIRGVIDDIQLMWRCTCWLETAVKRAAQLAAEFAGGCDCCS